MNIPNQGNYRIFSFVFLRFLNTDLKALIDLHTFNALNKMQDELDHAHGNKDGHHGHGKKFNDFGLDEEQANLMISAIEMHEIKVQDIMTNISKVFTLGYDTVIDSNTIRTIVSKGFSRIPIYKDTKDNLIGIFKINSLIRVNPDSKKTIKELGIDLYQPIVLTPETSVYDCLQALRKGRSQMAFITHNIEELKKKLVTTLSRRQSLSQQKNPGTVENKDTSNLNNSSVKEALLKEQFYSSGLGHTNDNIYTENRPVDVIGIITLEDVIERMIKIDIYDEEDYITKKARASVYPNRSGSRMSIKEHQISKFLNNNFRSTRK